MHVQAFLWTYIFISLGQISRGENSGAQDNLWLAFKEID